MSWGNWRNNITYKKKKNQALVKIFESFITFVLVLFIIISGLLSFLIPYEIIMKCFIYTFFILFIISIIYFGLIADKEERIIMITMWKVYITSAAILIVALYSIQFTQFSIKSDFLKTQINYDITINNTLAKSNFNAYSDYILNYLELQKEEQLTSPYELIKRSTKEGLTQTTKETFSSVWYKNSLFGMLNTITLFMFLWYWKELKLKENLFK